MRRIIYGAIAVLGSAAFLLFTLGSSSGPSGKTYKIEVDNAYDLVKGGVFKVAGVKAGTITSIGLDRKTLHAVITVQVTQGGFGQFHSDAFCQTRPQSLIGEYFIDCQPGTKGKALPSGSTIPASHTQSTIPADLVQNIMRLPYRQRFTLIINELGAAVAARSEDLQTALRRADPALAETDNLLHLLANDANTIKSLNVNANTVITALAKNNRDVTRFIQYADRTSTASATQAPSIQATWEKLPAFLEQLRPAMAKLGAAADAQVPVLQNLNDASSNLNRFFHDLVPFSNESVPSLRSLGQASLTGRSAVTAATPTIKDLNQFAKPTPELAKNLAIVLHDLDNRSRAVEPDPRSPDGGRGYTGLESVLQYVYNITQAINYFGPFGHLLGVDGFADSTCSPYTTPQTLANNLANYRKGTSPENPRRCYAFLGPDQQGVTQSDPSWTPQNATAANPSRCVPDPGGYPVAPAEFHIHYHGAPSSACRLQAQAPIPAADKATASSANQTSGSPPPSSSSNANSAGASSSPSAASTATSTVHKTVHKATGVVQSTLGSLYSNVKNAVNGVRNGVGRAGVRTSVPTGAGSATVNRAQQLLNYLLAP